MEERRDSWDDDGFGLRSDPPLLGDDGYLPLIVRCELRGHLTLREREGLRRLHRQVERGRALEDDGLSFGEWIESLPLAVS